jgi:hypothetical protein
MKQMPAEFSQSKGLYLPPNVAAEIDAVRKTEKRGFRKIEVDARLGSTALDCLYYHPDVATDDTPIGIAEGLGAPRGVYLEVAEAVAELGRPVILYKPPRVENALSAFQPENIRDPLIFQMKAVHAALKAIHNSERVTELRGGRPVSEVDLAGHSMGNYIAVGAAHHDTVEQPGDVSIQTKSVWTPSTISSATCRVCFAKRSKSCGRPASTRKLVTSSNMECPTAPYFQPRMSFSTT